MCIEEKSARMPNSRNALTSTHALEIENPNGKRLWNVNLLTAPRHLSSRAAARLGSHDRCPYSFFCNSFRQAPYRRDATAGTTIKFQSALGHLPCLGKGRAVAFTECGS
jgi:hypothetical protein